MTRLHGALVNVELLSEHDKAAMFSLMDEFYDDTSLPVFLDDLAEKETCIVLRDSNDTVRGFSTQVVMSVEVAGERVHGVFSGDTIIHRDYWGGIELYQLFARHFIRDNRRYPKLYWFLISKGYKTYKMLPLFFRTFYPDHRVPTPITEQRIMDAYASARYPDEYQTERGVIVYQAAKDRLKPGVADITGKHLKNRDIRHFVHLNPDHAKGNDLVCLAELSESNLRPAVRRLLFGE